MKALKLKPIYFPNDDILVKPPDFISIIDDFQQERKNKTISSTEQLKTILRGRQLKKQDNLKLGYKEEDEETVKKLSEWKCFESPRPGFKRKFTFKRGNTMSTTGNEAKLGGRSTSVTLTLNPFKRDTIDSVVTAVQGIVAIERLKKKVLDAEIKEISDRNKDYEENIRNKINKINKELEGLKLYMRENIEKLEKIKKDFSEVQRIHDEELNTVNLREAHELLFNDKGRKKSIKPGDESQYFIKKEKIRQQKQDLHRKYQESKELYLNSLETTKRSLDLSESHRLECKKELKTYREEMIMLYCRALKDGKDTRSDGLRWVIKALWLMNECIPISAFPKFFDDESSHFLLALSEKDLELESYMKKLDNLRRDIKSKRTSFSITTARDLYKTVRSRLRNISQSSVGQVPDGTGINEDHFEDVATSVKEDHGGYEEMTSLKDKINEIHESIKEMTRQEIKRITESYQQNPGEAEKVGLFHYIKCLVGDKVREFNKYTRSSGNKSKARVSMALP